MGKNAWIIVSTAATLLSCAGLNQIPGPEPLGELTPGLSDTLYLRVVPPSDSIVITRPDVTILLSMREVEEYASAPRYDPQGHFSALFSEIRDAFQHRSGRLETESGVDDYLIADFLSDGRAAIRMNSGGSFVPWIVLIRMREQSGASAFSGRSFYLPGGNKFLQIIDTITRS